jgi:hypothetical protein
MTSPFTASRRQLLQTLGCGFGSLALAGLCADQVRAAGNPLATKAPHHPAKAKRIIFVFMQGGPSHVDSYDYKPQLIRDHGKTATFHNARSMKTGSHKLMAPLWKFKQHGESGRWVSDLFPHMAEHVDDYCVIRGMHTDGVAHGPATLFLHTGATNLVRPSMGSWVNYGLGSESENLPGFVTLGPPATQGGPRLYSNAFLPTIYQGTAVGRAGLPAAQSDIPFISNDHMPVEDQRQQLALLQGLNHEQLSAHGRPDEMEAVIDSFELGFRMQQHAPDTLDLSNESEETLRLYGIGEKATDDFGRQCLRARRLSEAGVRYVQVNYSDQSNNPRWDQHGNMPKHADHALATDKPVAGLLKDLKRRGLLEDTLVWWGGEFGRTPFSQGNDGRDHNPTGFSVWLAGGGVKPGIEYGATDEYGFAAVENRVHMHDLHATILHLMGLDHERLTYRYDGRDFRLTDVHGKVVQAIIA